MTTAIVNARVIDGLGNPPADGMTVVFENGVITEVSPHPELPRDARVIDACGGTLTPGLIDVHVHLCHPLGDSSIWGGRMGRTLTRDEQTAHAVTQAARALDAGVTTVRDVGCPTDAVFAVRRLTSSDVSAGPQVFAAGQILCMTGGHGHQLFGYECDGVDEVVKATRLQFKRGADLIKLCATGGAATANEEITSSQFGLDEMQAIVREAHKTGKRVAAHAHGTEGIKQALRAGVDTIEHGVLLDDDAIETMLAAGTILVPTLSVYHALVARGIEKGAESFVVDKATAVIPLHSASIAQARKAGVRIAFGTDSGGPYHPVGGPSAVEQEFRLLQRCGLDALEVFRAATHTAAVALGIDRTHGSVEVGKAADLVLFLGDPLADLGLLSRPSLVVRSGVVVRAPAVVGGCYAARVIPDSKQVLDAEVVRPIG